MEEEELRIVKDEFSRRMGGFSRSVKTPLCGAGSGVGFKYQISISLQAVWELLDVEAVELLSGSARGKCEA